MDYIKQIFEIYHGNILLQPPCQSEISSEIPQELRSILSISNGIQETITTPLIDQREVIGWIIYPYDTIMSDTDFYKATYKIDGIVFASDGAGNPFVIKPNGSIVCFTGIDCEETEVANSLSNFFQLQ